MEKSFQAYRRLMDKAVKAETIRDSMASIGLTGHFFQAGDGTLKPKYYPGFTLITPTYGDDAGNKVLYQTLVQARAVIKEKFPAHKFVEAPERALHMTLARLVSGELFEKKILGPRENDVLSGLKALFLTIPPQKGLIFAVKGIAVRHGIIAAMVSAEEEDSYRRLQSFRDAVYADKSLIDCGVERKRGFTGHITLIYIEEELTGTEKAGLAETVIATNKAYFPQPLPFFIHRGEVRRFDNYLDFFREKEWPVFSFGG